MLADDELKDMAADIAERGLLQPIVLDEQGRILDGRNRYAACELAGVEPEFTTYDGEDPDGYALSVNIARRHLTKGQIAMVAARSDDLIKKQSQRSLAAHLNINQSYIANARTVLKYVPDLAEAVLSGYMPLSEAYQAARERKREQGEREADVAALHSEAPDLAERVAEERLALADALAELEARREEAREEAERREEEERLRTQVAEIDAVRDADGAPPPTFADRAESGSITWEEALTLARQWQTERAESIERDRNRLRQVVSNWGAVRTVAEMASNPYVADVLDGLGETDRAEIERIVTEWKG